MAISWSCILFHVVFTRMSKQDAWVCIKISFIPFLNIFQAVGGSLSVLKVIGGMIALAYAMFIVNEFHRLLKRIDLPKDFFKDPADDSEKS